MRRLDDLHRPEGSVLAGSYPSGQPQVLEVRGLRQALPVLGSVLVSPLLPQVFTRVMAPVSSIPHSLGIRLRRNLDDWLIQAHSREEVLRSLETFFSLCHELGIVVNFVPSQRVLYLGTILNIVLFKASPSQQQVEKLLSIGEEFLS